MFSFPKTQVDASTIAWIDDYLTHKTVRETEGLCVKPGGQQHRSATGDRTLPVSSQTASTKQTPVICRNTLVTLKSLGGSEMEKKLNIESW